VKAGEGIEIPDEAFLRPDVLGSAAGLDATGEEAYIVRFDVAGRSVLFRLTTEQWVGFFEAARDTERDMRLLRGRN
jgi:hypothetical protein